MQHYLQAKSLGYLLILSLDFKIFFLILNYIPSELFLCFKEIKLNRKFKIFLILSGGRSLTEARGESEGC